MSDNQGFVAWIDARFPMTKVWNEHLAEYYAPKNFNFWYFMGSLAMLVLVNQIMLYHLLFHLWERIKRKDQYKMLRALSKNATIKKISCSIVVTIRSM